MSYALIQKLCYSIRKWRISIYLLIGFSFDDNDKVCNLGVDR